MASEINLFYLERFSLNQQNIIFQGDAGVTSKGKLRLTKTANGELAYQSVGRALHVTPVRIRWGDEVKERKVANFFTCFSFTIHARDVNKTGDGLAFFLARQNDTPKQWTGHLGLPNEGKRGSLRVAVEFNTFINKNADIDDPNYLHIGLDFMNIKSTEPVPWEFENDSEAVVFISYDASAKSLEATLVYRSSRKSYSLSMKEVDLRKALPQWVEVGFSASTGQSDPKCIETHEVNFWFFASSFKDDPATLAQALKGNNPDVATFLPHHSKGADRVTSSS